MTSRHWGSRHAKSRSVSGELGDGFFLQGFGSTAECTATLCIMDSYDSLDDVPLQLRRFHGSPTPTHYSMITNTPSPNLHHQVMSPNPLMSTPGTASSPATATTPTAAAEHQQLGGGWVTMRTMSQVQLPGELLRSFATSISDDISFAADIQAALVELASRIQFRTETLGTALGEVGTVVQSLQSGYSQVARGLEQVHTDLQRQQEIVASLVEARDANRFELDQLKADLQQYLERRDQENLEVHQKLDDSLQREAAFLATVETLSGKVVQLEESMKHLARNVHEHRRQLDEHATIVYAPLEDSAGDTTTAQAVRRLSERVDRELDALRNSSEQQGVSLQLLQQKCLEVTGRVDEWDDQNADLEMPGEGNEDHASPTFGTATRRATTYYELTPEASNQQMSAVAEAKDREQSWWNNDWEFGEYVASNVWGLTEPPPGLAEPSRSTGPTGLQGVTSGKSEGQPIHHGRWKLLNDIPPFAAGGGEPWETNMRLKTWWRQVETVAETVDPRFGLYVARQLGEAERRHQLRLEGQFELEDPKPVAPTDKEMESRLTLLLIRCLPTELKQPVLENMNQQTIQALELLEGILEQQQPGGPQEMKSLQGFIRHMDPAPTAREAQESLRRWKLARTRAGTLGLPGIAPYEELQALSSLVKTLERRSDTFRTLLGLLRTRPEIIRPTPEGVSKMVQLVEQQLQILCAEEVVRRNRKEGEDTSQAYKGKGKGKKGKGKEEKLGKGNKSDAKGKQGKSSDAAKQSGKDGGADVRKTMPCHYFWTDAGCTRQSCPFSHDEKHRPKQPSTSASRAQALIGAEGQDGRAAQAEKPKAKAKARAKASSVISVARMARSIEGLSEGSSGRSEGEASLLSEISAEAVDSEGSTRSIQSSEAEQDDLHDAMIEAIMAAQMEREDLGYLVLDADEYIRWSQPGVIQSRANRQWTLVDMGPNATPNVAVAIWMVLRHEEFETPMTDVSISPTQQILNITQILIMCADGVVREAYLAWCVDLESGNEVFMAVTRYSYNPWVRPYLDPPEPKSQTAPPRRPTANRATVDEHGGDCVLLDTGANEIVRMGCGPKPARSRLSPLQLADGSQVEAWRTRDGDIYIESNEGTATLCGVCRLISVGASFLWNKEGAHLQMPEILGGDWIQLQIQNGLPYLRWEHFRRLRPLLSRNYKSCCSMAQGNAEPQSREVVAWTNLEDFIVEQEKTAEVNALLSCDGEEFARQLVEEDRAVTLEEVNKALKEAQLPAVKTNRMNKVSNEEKMLDLWVFGSWKRGGLGGVTRVTKARPWLTKVLTNFMRQKTDEPFMAITVSQDVIFKPHKDPNDCTFATTLIGMTTYEGGELWIEQPETQSENSKAVWRTVKEGEPPRPGKLHPTANGRVVQFFGNQLHGTEDYRGGTRRVMIGYIPRGWRRLQADDMNVLRSLGFRIPGSSLRPTSEPQQQADLQSQAQISITQLNHNHTSKPELLSPIAIGGLEEEKGFGCEGHEEFWEDVCKVQDETRMGHGDSERDLLGWDIQGCNERAQTREVSDLTAEQAMAFLAEPEVGPFT